MKGAIEANTTVSFSLIKKHFFRFCLTKAELVALKWEDIDFQNKTLKIQRSMEYRYSVGEWRIGEPKSKSGYRTIPLTDEAIDILRRQKEKNKTMNLYVHTTEEEKLKEIELVADALNVV